ncbi:MAG TPA: N-acetylneuraminate synthase family protein [Thermoanaerobaculia bacterium]|nr:N-acetylneuraminate synthase family protein [Thermoanaerobaculia bacterium]
MSREPGVSLRSLLPARPGGSGPPSSRCIVIGEVAQAHDGSLGFAHAFIDAIAAAGADAVKFQTHIASAESTPTEPWRVRFSPQDATRYDYWKRMEFSEDAWHKLKKHADEKNLWFLSSPFSVEAIELLERVGVAAWKVASGETSNLPFLERLTRDGQPVLLSTGMSSTEEIDSAVELVRSRGRALAVMQCTSAYPCPPEKVGLNLISQFRERYGCAVGLSDHSGTIYPGLAAATLGIDVLEVHVTLSREMFGPDVPASLTPSELRQLTDGVRYIERMTSHPVDKDESARETAPLHDLFTKSVVARIDLPAGTVLKAEHLAAKKPGTGIPAGKLPDLIGVRLARSVAADQLLSEQDLERVS